MLILVMNAGSSYYKIDVIDSISKHTIVGLKAERVPQAPAIELNKNALIYTGEKTPDAVMRFCLAAIKDALKDQSAVQESLNTALANTGGN